MWWKSKWWEKEEKTLICSYIPCLVSWSLTDAEKQIQKEQQGIFMPGDTCKIPRMIDLGVCFVKVCLEMAMVWRKRRRACEGCNEEEAAHKGFWYKLSLWPIDLNFIYLFFLYFWQILLFTMLPSHFTPEFLRFFFWIMMKMILVPSLSFFLKGEVWLCFIFLIESWNWSLFKSIYF